MASPTDVLLQLAADFAGQGRYGEAIRCLQPVTESSELPATKVKARLAMAQLLLAHFDNEDEARKQLTQAELELRHTHCSGQQLLQCEVADTLGRCHWRTGALAQEKEAYATGLQACEQGASNKDRAVLARWRAYFTFRLVEYTLRNDGAEQGLAALAALDSLQDLTQQEQALHLLCRAFLQLQASLQTGTVRTEAMERVNRSLIAAAEALERMGLADGGPVPGALLLRVHHLVLYVSTALASGHIKSIRQDEDFPILVQLHELIAEAQQSSAQGGASSDQWGFDWMPLPALAGLAHVLHSALLRGIGRMGQASVHLARGQEIISQELKRYPLDLDGVESSLSKATVVGDGVIYARLRILLLEEEAVVALVTSNFEHAAAVLCTQMGILDRFPILLQDFIPSAQMLAGHYAHSVGEYGVAAAHFRRILEQDEASDLHNLATLATALSELHDDPGPGGVRSALQVLQQQDLTTGSTIAVLPVHERAACHLVNGLLAIRQDEEKNASMQLTLALKQAHDSLHNTQFVGQVLNSLAPLSAAKQDSDGAQQMLKAAFTLVKSLGDTSSLLTTILGLEKLHAQLEDTGPAAKDRRGYMEKKTEELLNKVQAAKATREHKALLKWAPAAHRTPN